MSPVFDVAIIGGGINGCGCAADAALRGLSVILFEQDDLASKTSSSSTKLIHGGLRYLENFEFSLVKKALSERQKLLNLAPHLIHSQPLVLPYEKHMRPAWFLRLGLFIYDHLNYKNKLPNSESISRIKQKKYFLPLRNTLNKGFLFYDAITDDARLTILNALQAKNHGATIRTQSTVIHTEIKNDLWELTIKPKNGSYYILYAKSIINAAGPWVKSVEAMTHVSSQQKISLVKGSHLVVPQIYEGNHAYFLQHKDQRVIFVIPYHGFSLIGTTDIPFNESLQNISISSEETHYLLDLVNVYFNKKISAPEIIHTWSGVRTLVAEDDKKAQALTRDYTYEVQLKPAPIITIYGGKITTYRKLAEEVINQLKSHFPHMGFSTTAHTPLPGAEFKNMNFEQYVHYAKDKYHWMDPKLLNRYLYTYGSCMEKFLAFCSDEHSLGKKYCTYLYQVEIDYLITEEWAQSSDDILNRRTKLGLIIDAEGRKELANYLTKFNDYLVFAAPLLLH